MTSTQVRAGGPPPPIAGPAPTRSAGGPEHTGAITLSSLARANRVRRSVALLGPAFVAAAAYVDPGNIATNVAAGARHGYLLVWVVAAASAMAVLVQYLSSKAGLATGQSLPELCRDRYGRGTNLVLWVQAELVAIATDIAEFVGAALGLHLVFGMSLLPAGVVTGVVAFALLGLQRRGYRRFEIAVIAMLALVAAGFGYLFLAGGHPSYGGVASGLIPRLPGGDGLTLAVGIVGATVMPHAIYLHSAMQSRRIRPADDAEARTLLRFNRFDCIAGLGAAGIVNVAMLCVAAEIFAGHHVNGLGDFTTAHAELTRLAGGSAALVFGVALMASGFASSGVGTYAGQVVMAGFTGWRIPLLVRRAVTMAPALLVLGIGANLGAVLVASQVALCFGIPFALVPLVRLTRNRAVMGELVNRAATTAAVVAITVVICALDAALVYTTVAG